MKKILVITTLITSVISIVSCNDVKRSPGRDYMPDMKWSRAYETYAAHDNLVGRNINYTAQPVEGTVKRGEAFPFSIPKDKVGDTTNYIASRQVPNPLPAPDQVQLKEAERQYLINCAICHGTNLDGNGPLFNNGAGPYPAAPRNLVSDAKTLSMPDGQMFYSITYGFGAMGPYGSQLTTSQRWQIVHYIRSRQAAGKGTTGGGSSDTTSAAAGGGAATGAGSGSGGSQTKAAAPATGM